MLLCPCPGTQPPWGIWPGRRQEVIEGFFGVLSGFGHPDFLQSLLGLLLGPFGELIQNVGRLMYPTALGAGVAIDLGQGLPEAQTTITHRQLGPFFKPRRLRSKSNSLQDCSLSR